MKQRFSAKGLEQFQIGPSVISRAFSLRCTEWETLSFQSFTAPHRMMLCVRPGTPSWECLATLALGQFLSVYELTGDGHGEVEAELTDFSLSSGSSTEDIRVGRALNRRRL